MLVFIIQCGITFYLKHTLSVIPAHSRNETPGHGKLNGKELKAILLLKKFSYKGYLKDEQPLDAQVKMRARLLKLGDVIACLCFEGMIQ